MPYRCQASGFRPYAVEGRSMVAVTHLALLGVKIQDSAFWGTQKKRQSLYAAAFAVKAVISKLLRKGRDPRSELE